MRSRRSVTLLVLALAWSTAAGSGLARPGARKLKVYVHNPPEASAELSPAKRRELSDSADDVRAQIPKRRRLVLVQSLSSADVVVTILDRRVEVRETGQINYGGGYTQSHYQSRHILKYRIQAGQLFNEQEYILAGAFVTWKRIAGGVSKDVERWVDDNLEMLLREIDRRGYDPLEPELPQ